MGTGGKGFFNTRGSTWACREATTTRTNVITVATAWGMVGISSKPAAIEPTATSPARVAAVTARRRPAERSAGADMQPSYRKITVRAGNRAGDGPRVRPL